LTILTLRQYEAGIGLLPDQRSSASGDVPAGRLQADDDGRLVLGVRSGDQRAFTALVGRHFKRVYRVAYRLVGPADAEDVAQEAFMRLWQRPHGVRDGTAIGAWLVRVASNLAIDRLRRSRPNDSGEGIEHADMRPLPDETVAVSQASRRIDEAISALPDRQRLALVLTYYEGMGNQETAKTMDLSVEAVESLLSRARRNIKSRLASEWQDLLREIGES